MALSLQEQMLKAGLVNQKKVAKAKKASKKSRVQNREAKAAVELNKAAQAEKDKELSLKHKAEKEQKELTAQIKQLITANKLDRTHGDIGYNFTDGTLVKKMYVDKTMQTQLIAGRLAIVHFNEDYEIVPAGVADKITLRDESVVVLNNVIAEDAQDEDDPYAEFVIPDDLMW
ncbi:DUF2058 domain-containing protein [Aliivibrio sp. S3MY1]|uniref:DUF2058 domain-containing protein n=1 Tax=unclassified Aliivibrio TaxID=2645654 RepID=UPI002378253B|nr:MULTISPECIES: DUF2058 domain-containing protein [unclassified Aliivibrio]MDD9194345.1 DUF2058 domain-containing protein [Aliivibrio sp. S3MY1]MDD9198013.1 DUF2058 domain-containing protein [Aliivibrio sp. S2MY1]